MQNHERVLVAYGSKHGSTAEIADRIGERLREAGHEVDVLPAGSVTDLDRYEAVVLGSAVYMPAGAVPPAGCSRSTAGNWPSGRSGCSAAAPSARSGRTPSGGRRRSW
jgi:hypothetical protein